MILLIEKEFTPKSESGARDGVRELTSIHRKFRKKATASNDVLRGTSSPMASAECRKVSFGCRLGVAHSLSCLQEARHAARVWPHFVFKLRFIFRC